MSVADKDAQENALQKISKDRKRTNLLKKQEQNLIAYLVQRMPQWVTSDRLTAFGFFGSLLIGASFVLATFVDHRLLLLSILGFAINWFGDSLDGRLAYYRNKPRKWYGFSLDFTVDWLTNIVIGIGLAVYMDDNWQLMPFLFIMLYGWAMIMALLRYKITNNYSIDSSHLGPTEVRIIVCLILTLEVVVPGTLKYVGSAACVILLIVDIIDFKKLLKSADELDIQLKKEKENQTIQ